MGWPWSAVRVAGDSMMSTLQPGDLLLVARRGRILPGDIVMVRRPDRPGLIVVKRVLARDPDGWWLEGDNPDRSDDSRLFGVVPEHAVLGRILLRYWSPRTNRRSVQACTL